MALGREEQQVVFEQWPWERQSWTCLHHLVSLDCELGTGARLTDCGAGDGRHHGRRSVEESSSVWRERLVEVANPNVKRRWRSEVVLIKVE